jgi:hypothetical protein
MLEAHKALCKADRKNNSRFKKVLDSITQRKKRVAN